MVDYIEKVGLTYEDPQWVAARRRDLASYLRTKGITNPSSVNDIMYEEQPRMQREYQMARINAEGIKVIIEDRERILNSDISYGYGHSKIGLYEDKVIKTVNSVGLYPEVIVRIDLIKTFSDMCLFIKRAIELHQLVPSVVELYPVLLITTLEDRHIFSIMMKIAPGKPLAMVWQHFDDEDKQQVRERTIEIIEAMGDQSYGFSDFALDNIMYDKDTDTITIIDIKPTDFGRKRRFIDDSIMNIYSQMLG